MGLLLDTHVFRWAAADPEELAAPARLRIADPSREIYVSRAVAREIAIKASHGKISVPDNPKISR